MFFIFCCLEWTNSTAVFCINSFFHLFTPLRNHETAIYPNNPNAVSTKMAAIGIRSIVEKWTVFCLFYFTDHSFSISQLHVELVCLRYLHGKVKCFAKILKIAKNKCKSRPIQRTREQNVPGGTPLYKLYRCVPPHQVGSLRPFGLKTGIHFAQFGLESGMVFEGTTGVYERIYRFNSKWVRKKEKYANSKWIWIIFCLRSNLSNDNIISA